MPFGLRQFGIAILAVLLGLGVAAQAASPREQGPVRIVLHRQALAAGREIFLGDVARLEGGSDALRQKLARLGLDEFPSHGGDVAISREQVGVRIRLAGVGTERFQLEGAQAVEVCRGKCVERGAQSAERLEEEEEEDLTEKGVETAARQLLLERLPWKPEDVSIRLHQIGDWPAVEVGEEDRVSLRPELGAATNLLGKVEVDVALFVNDEPAGVVPVCFDVRLHQEVAVATRRIERGEALGPDNITRNRRAVNTGNYLSYAEAVAGKRSRRLILPGQMMMKSDIEAATPEHAILVKQQDTVKLVARVGSMRVTATGEALQEGRAGQLIRVRNLDSKKILTGRVVSRGTVEVDGD